MMGQRVYTSSWSVEEMVGLITGLMVFGNQVNKYTLHMRE